MCMQRSHRFGNIHSSDNGPRSKESTCEPINYGRFINQFPSDTIKSMQRLERINPKMFKQRMSILFDPICINEIHTHTHIYIYMYIHTHTYIYTHIYIYIYIHTHTHTRTHIYVCVYIYMYLYMCVYIYIYIYVCVCVCVCEQDLALNYAQEFICHKATKLNQIKRMVSENSSENSLNLLWCWQKKKKTRWSQKGR